MNTDRAIWRARSGYALIFFYILVAIGAIVLGGAYGLVIVGLAVPVLVVGLIAFASAKAALPKAERQRAIGFALIAALLAFVTAVVVLATGPHLVTERDGTHWVWINR